MRLPAGPRILTMTALNMITNRTDTILLHTLHTQPQPLPNTKVDIPRLDCSRIMRRASAELGGACRNRKNNILANKLQSSSSTAAPTITDLPCALNVEIFFLTLCSQLDIKMFLTDDLRSDNYERKFHESIAALCRLLYCYYILDLVYAPCFRRVFERQDVVTSEAAV